MSRRRSASLFLGLVLLSGAGPLTFAVRSVAADRPSTRADAVALAVLLVAAALVGLTAHLGGSMVHGTDYLFGSSAGETVE